MKMPQWLDRLRKRARKQSQDRAEQRDVLSSLLGGRGKHGRQRVRPKNYWSRRRALERKRDKRRKRRLLLIKRNKQRRSRHQRKKGMAV